MQIITRQEWGAGQCTWPPTYRSRTTLIVFHHSAGPLPSASDLAAAVRQVWQEHAVTNGWGDIGYHFLIDPFGNIYEGRYGGDGVVGGHDYTSNDYAEGICFLGDYNQAVPTDAAIAAGGWLAGQRCRRWSLDPRASIIGHRDDYPTACPGDNLYARLPDLRRLAAGNQPQPTEDDMPQPIAAADFAPKFSTFAKAGELLYIMMPGGTAPGKPQPPGGTVTIYRCHGNGYDGVASIKMGPGNMWTWKVPQDGYYDIDGEGDMIAVQQRAS